MTAWLYTQNQSQKGGYEKGDGYLGHPVLEYALSSIPPSEITWADS